MAKYIHTKLTKRHLVSDAFSYGLNVNPESSCVAKLTP
jgi:hypothetical protein